MRIAVGADHAGVHLKDALADHLRALGHEVTDVGTHGEDRVNYPDFGAAVGRLVADGSAERGVLVCGSGIGICMAANKVHGIRAGVAYDNTTAELMRAHNDAQIICFGERLTSPDVAVKALDVFLATPFEGGRHQERVALIDQIEA